MQISISKENIDGLLTWKAQIVQFMGDLAYEYPKFDEWLNRVFDEISQGKRVILLDVEGGVIRGLAILKDTVDEKKVCTLRVDERYRRQGIGSALIKESYRILRTDTPLMTVSEKHIDIFKDFLRENGAKLFESVTGLYNNGEQEFFFNHPYDGLTFNNF